MQSKKINSLNVEEEDEDITVTITKFTMTGKGYFGVTDKGEKAYVPSNGLPYGYKIKKLGTSYKAYLIRKIDGLYNIYWLKPPPKTQKINL